MSHELKKAIVLTLGYYGRSAMDEVIQMYVDDLADLDPRKCIAAYSRWRSNPANRTFPLPADIRVLVNPEEYVAPEAQAREIAGRVVGAAVNFGHTNAKKAQVYIGPVGWSIVQRYGGWLYICENLGCNFDVTTFQAQFRDQAEALLRYGPEAMDRAINTMPGAARKSELTATGSVLELMSKRDEPKP
jgi:hypothetical protein